MKYIIFAGDDFYARGGASDIKNVGDDLDALVNSAKSMKVNWWHVLELSSMKIVAHKYGGYCGRILSNDIIEVVCI